MPDTITLDNEEISTEFDCNRFGCSKFKQCKDKTHKPAVEVQKTGKGITFVVCKDCDAKSEPFDVNKIVEKNSKKGRSVEAA